jgi:hypothetical protein
MPPTLDVTDPLLAKGQNCIGTDGTLPKVVEVATTFADGTILRERVTLTEAKTTWSVPAGGQKVTFRDVSGECPAVTRIVH